MRLIFKILIPLLLLLVFGGLVFALIRTAPEAQENAEHVAPLAVEVIQAQEVTPKIELPVRGRVRALWTSEVASEVSGLVESVHDQFKQGGMIPAGDSLLQIDAEDYRTALAEADAEVAAARLELAQEEARSSQAQRDWEELGQSGQPSTLTLRAPQLEHARTRLNAAQARHDLARRNVERTALKAPFTARVVSVATERGSVLNAGAIVATLQPVDRFEVTLPIAVDQLSSIDLASQPEARLGIGRGIQRREWNARILRTQGEVDPASRTIGLIGEIERNPSPEAAEKDPLVPGLFLEGTLQGRSPGPRLQVPRAALLDGDAVFIVNAQSQLERREIDSDWSDEQFVYVRSGLAAGDRVVTTTLQGAVAGTEVEVMPESSPAAEPSTEPNAPPPVAEPNGTAEPVAVAAPPAAPSPQPPAPASVKP